MIENLAVSKIHDECFFGILEYRHETTGFPASSFSVLPHELLTVHVKIIKMLCFTVNCIVIVLHCMIIVLH